jgi:gamma-glutamyltranspeptidase/glutathione hydrolase
MGLCINVTQPDFTNFGGVAPIMVYSSLEDKVTTISGLGTWPKAASIELLQERGGNLTEDQFLSSVVPSAPDAWITVLDQFGTMSFTEVAQRALVLAENGFPAHPTFINDVLRREKFQRWKSTKNVFFPSGTIPQIGDLIVQKDLATTFKRLIRVEEQNRHLGRHGALMAVRDEFYEGDIAKELIKYLQENGGIMTLEDMASFHVELEKPIMTTYQDVEVYCCGPWCQGPVNAIALNILEGYDLGSMEHNSAEYIHLLVSALDLAFSDREKYIGDPRFTDVPINELTSKKYGRLRRSLIDTSQAFRKMPPYGDPKNFIAAITCGKNRSLRTESNSCDTSYGCVVDKSGNAFSATPSDGGRLVPGLGIVISPRGAQSWLDPKHPSSVEPGKRPRLTPNPALAFKDGKLFMAYGTPGGDSQPQTMVQILLNVVDFNMNVQRAIEAPRFRSENFPNSFWPHEYHPARLNIEGRIPQKTINQLKEMGYDLNVYPDWTYKCGGACAIHSIEERRLLMGGADPRRECYAIGY